MSGTLPTEDDRKWGRFALALWALWGLAFAVFEFLGLRAGKDGWPPLTRVVVRYIPRWVVMGGIGWLAWHFHHAYR